MKAKHNACIAILSARKEMLPTCLKNFSLYHPCDYDLYVYQFGNIYTDDDKEKVINSYSGKVTFVTIHPKVPPHLSEVDLFYNRTYNQYARFEFPKSRTNYLHMCNFLTWELFERQELSSYDYIIRFDDDSWFKKSFGFDVVDKFIEEESKRNGELFCINSYFWGMNEQFNPRHSQTRENLFNFVKSYVESNEVCPKSSSLRRAIDDNDEIAFHKMGWKSDLSVWKNGFQYHENWINWVDRIRKHGGIYKHRWGCCELHHLYGYMYYKDGVHNMNLKEQQLYDGHLPNFYIIR